MAEPDMAEPDAKQIYTNALPLIALVMMASGIIVKSVPLESRRPVDPQRMALVQAGRQDVEARLWEDPFTAIRGVKGATPAKRCEEAANDLEHQRLALHKSIAFRAARGSSISVLAATVLGGPYFEEGEARRRTRYAVVSALLQTGWEPVSEDKLGYVWTLEGCIEPASARWAPELLPYEWFRIDGTPRRDLLVLWVDQNSIARRPLKGMERIVELLALPCPSLPERSGPDAVVQKPRDCLREPGPDARLSTPLEARGCENALGRKMVLGKVERPLPWCETRVIGPATSGPLERLVRELAQDPHSATPADWLRFYSSAATVPLEIRDIAFTEAGSDQAKRLKDLFAERVIRLTATDDRLIDTFTEELARRLADPTPFSRLRDRLQNRSPLCASTVVLVSEGDTSYAREFRQRFTSERFGRCREGSLPRIVPVNYLRGLDGVLPPGAGAPAPTPAAPQARTPDARDALLDPVTLERADGRSQFDYLRRLAQELGDIDREEKRAGRNGIRGIGLLGNDAYDKLLVLDALRDRFPEAVFFAADLDARLVAGGARSTRNLVVASAYGLMLNPGIQGAAPPFRDTYQTGTYLATRIALDPDTAALSQDKFDPWFREPLLFEIGRTRPVPLSQGSTETCGEENLMDCDNIHPLDEWLDATPFPGPTVALALAAMLASAAALAFLLSRGAREAAASVWESCSPRRVAIGVALASAVILTVGAAGYCIWNDMRSGLGEPFAWFEGVSIWPTQIFRVGILLLTVGLLAFGRWQLRRKIDRVSAEFGLPSLTGREQSPLARADGWKEALQRICSGGTKEEDEGDPWVEYLDRMRFGPTTVRIALTSALFFAFSIALTSLDWPYSPHRGELAAWFNHSLLILLIGAMTTLLFAAFDASLGAARLLARLGPGVAVEMRENSHEKKLQERYPVGPRANEAWIRFRLAVRTASEVNGFIYLPFLTLLLIIPTQSSVFDAWDLPLPFAALMAISIGLAVMCTRRLRKAAERLKRDVLEEIDTELQNTRLGPPTGQGSAGSKEARELRAEMLERIAENIRAVRDGPFLPLSQEPVVRAILLLLGGAGGISTAQFLFVPHG